MNAGIPDLDPGGRDGQIVSRYQSLAYAYARRHGVRHEDAEDICQEVFLRSHRGYLMAGLMEDTAGGTKLIQTIARWVVASFRRHELASMRDRRRTQPMADWELIARGNDDEDGQARVRLLVEAMHTLRHEPVIHALRLKLSGYSYRRIAGILKKRVYDVTNYLHQAKNHLRNHIWHLLDVDPSKEECRPSPGAVRFSSGRLVKRGGRTR